MNFMKKTKYEILNKDEASERLRVSPKTLDRRIKSGKIPAYKEGGRVIIYECDLEDYITGLRKGITVR